MYKLQRSEALGRQIEQLAELRMLKPTVRRRQCFRGISLHSAMVLATERVDWRRFELGGQLACYLGFIPREGSSGNRQRLGSITKAGNSHGLSFRELETRKHAAQLAVADGLIGSTAEETLKCFAPARAARASCRAPAEYSGWSGTDSRGRTGP